MIEEPEDRLGMTEEQWETFKRLTRGYGEQTRHGFDVARLRASLRMSPAQRLAKLQDAHNWFWEVDRCRAHARNSEPSSKR